MSDDVQKMVAQFAKEQEQRKLALLEQMKKIEEEGEAQLKQLCWVMLYSMIPVSLVLIMTNPCFNHFIEITLYRV